MKSEKQGNGKKYRVINIIILVIALLLIVGYLGISILGGEKLKAARSIRKINDTLYTMEYEGDYGLDAYLLQGGGASSEEMADYLTEFLSNGLYKPEKDGIQGTPGCSTVSGNTADNTYLFGRNYDWQSGVTMVMHTKPRNGYESVSTTALEFLGFGEDWRPEGLANQMMALAGIYIPMDGINEKGLVIADLMAGDREETHQATEKADITTTVGIRLVLDRAATVDEAIELLQNYDMNSDIGTAHHYAVSDLSGRSVVIEYIDGETVVTETPVVTNHYLSEGHKNGIGSEQSKERFRILSEAANKNDGHFDKDLVRDSLRTVSQGVMGDEYEVTRWSSVYDLEQPSVDYYFGEDYSSAYSAALGGEDIFAGNVQFMFPNFKNHVYFYNALCNNSLNKVLDI